MTTNGFLLERDAEALVRAGVDRFNVSIDSLQRDRFYELTRRDALAQVLRGLEVLGSFPEAHPIKINAVAIRDFTEEEVLPFAEFARRTPYEVRFIEFMPLDADHAWTADQVLTGDEIRDAIDAVYPLEPEPREPQRHRAGLPVRRRPGPDRLHQPGLGAVLRRLQPHPADRRRAPADVPVLAERDRPARPDAGRRRRRRARADHPRRRVAQGAQAPRRRARLHPAGAHDVRNRRLIPPQWRSGIIGSMRG